ncbi:MAG TPA: type II toxin-antitoxin system RelE/ParE family toxin [Ferrovibrio sp.]|uniref:type II toxin-antitoxin system RelE/ParE family toxin n=1 Tax=Ferrovibrio sp. TaxID=1917215 RepID=UPI002ECFAF14
MLRAFKNRDFQKFMKAEGLANATIWMAVDEVEAGLVDATLGGWLIKKRVASPAMASVCLIGASWLIATAMRI